MTVRNCWLWGIFTLSTLLSTSFANAQMTCVDIFTQQETQTLTILPQDRGLLRNFEESRADLYRAKSNEVANESLYTLAISINLILDAVARNILSAKKQETPVEYQKTFLESSNVLVSVLQTQLKLPRKLLEDAVISRIENTIAEETALAEKNTNRLPLGFTARNREALKEAEEISEQQPLGYVKPSDPIGPIENISPGFNSKKSVPKDVDSVAEPIGFVRFADLIGPIQKLPIGFVHFENKNGETSPGLNRIIFNAETGDFEVIRPNYNVGF